MTAHRKKVEYANFRRFAQKSVSVTTFLERLQEKGPTDHAHPYM